MTPSDGVPLLLSDGVPEMIGNEADDYPMWSKLRLELDDTVPTTTNYAHTRPMRKAS